MAFNLNIEVCNSQGSETLILLNSFNVLSIIKIIKNHERSNLI